MQVRVSDSSAGARFTLDALASGRGLLSYQWFRNGRRLGVSTTVGPLTFRNAHRTNAGNYWLVVSNSFGARALETTTEPGR